MADAHILRLLKRSPSWMWFCCGFCDICMIDDMSSTASEYGNDFSMQAVAHIERFDESFSRPSSVAAHIDNTVDMWVSTIDEYRQLEQLIVAKSNSSEFTNSVNNSSFRGNSSRIAMLISTIKLIRSSPEAFIANLESQHNSDSKSISSDLLDLAHKRVLLHRIVSTLGISPQYANSDDIKSESQYLPQDPLIFSNFNIAKNDKIEITEKKKVVRRHSKTMSKQVQSEQHKSQSKGSGKVEIERISESSHRSSSAIAADRASFQVSQRVSKLWADRIELNTAVSPPQGNNTPGVGTTFSELYDRYKNVSNSNNFDQTDNNHESSGNNVWDSHVRPKWPLPDITFQVLSGLRQKRSLKLTEYHILDIKQGTKVCHVYLYTEVKKILLRSSQSIVIVLKNFTEVHYRSPIASHIVQQITSRVKLRLTLEKSNFSIPATDRMNNDSSSSNESNFQGVTYSAEATLKLVEEIASQNVVESGKTMRDFAVELGAQAADLVNKMVNAKRINDKSGNNLSSDVTVAEQQQEHLDVIKASSKKRSMHQGLLVTRSIRSFDSQTHESGSSEERVLMRIREILLDKCTPEGHTLKSYCDEFKQNHSLDNNCDRQHTLCRIRKVRKFTDAMAEHLILNRGSELASLLIAPQAFGSKSIPVAPLFEFHDLSVGEMAELTFLIFACVEESIFLPLKSMIVENLVESHNKTVSDSINRITEEYLNSRQNSSETMNSTTDTELQLHTFNQSRNSISELTDKELTKKIRILSNKIQSDWGVPDDFISPLCWKSAVHELSLLEHNLTPSVMMSALVKACKAIYTEYKCVVVPSYQKRYRSKEVKPLSADDFVPIFIFVFCNSDLRHPQLNRDIMWQLCHADQLRGEFGYFLTVYESAIEYICNERVVLPAPKNVVIQNSATQKGNIFTSDDSQEVLWSKKKTFFARRISTFIMNPTKRHEPAATESVTNVLHTLNLHQEADVSRETFVTDTSL